MKINHIRFANILLVGIIILAGKANYCWYIAAMHGSLEILNRQHLYLLQSPKIYNSIFWLYELVLLFRLRTFHFSADVEWLYNCAEHLCFGIIVCIKMYVYTAVFGDRFNRQRLRRGMIAALLFNCIGVFNEVFQNSLAHRMLFVFIEDSLKDLKMNLIGTAVFMCAVVWRVWVVRNAQNRFIVEKLPD